MYPEMLPLESIFRNYWHNQNFLDFESWYEQFWQELHADPIKLKAVKRFKKYLIHDEKNDINVGDTVSAIECRPLSKTKSFRLLEIVKRGEV